MEAREHLLQFSSERLRGWLAARGQPPFRAGQIRRWLYQKRADRFEQMTDLPQGLRASLAESFAVWTSQIAAHRRAKDGTEKLLLAMHDGQQVECVLLGDARRRRTICISTQVGCTMGCAFCASGLGGLVRNLSAGEIVEQMLRLAHLLPPDERLSRIVVMGIGEPLANLDALLPALQSAASSDGLGIGARRVTISTVGLPAGIRRLAESGLPYHLAISLHAADDALRRRLVPAARKVSIATILEAADAYFERTGRRVTYEYVLLAGVNDQPGHAEKLAALVRGRPALVNVIPYNPVEELPFRPPTAAATRRFVGILRQAGVNAQIRRRQGERIDAACGQLRRRGQMPGKLQGAAGVSF